MPSRNPAKRFEEAHWGIPSTRVFTYSGPFYDGYYPGQMPEMGKLNQLVYTPLNARAKAAITFEGPTAILAFATTKDERLWPIYSEADGARLAREFPLSDLHRGDIQQWNQVFPGRHSSFPFYRYTQNGRRIRLLRHTVGLIGVLHAVAYNTEKKGDGPSVYHHTHGDESGDYPGLVIDAHGRLFVVGGNYTVPNPGITD